MSGRLLRPTFPRPPVRVMHVVYVLKPGGMEFGVVKLANGLDRTRVRSAICSTKPAGALRASVSADVPVFELNRRDGNDPGLVWQLWRLFRRERPDIVHTHAWGTLLEGLIAARLAGVPAVVHGEHGTLQLRRHQRQVQRLAWKRVDALLSVSSRLAERMALETGFAPDRIATLRNGVDLRRFDRVNREQARAAMGIDATQTVVAAVGRLVPVKDHMTLLDAAARMTRGGIRFTLLIAGDGPLRQAIADRITALGLGDRVTMLGHRDDVEHVLAAADVFVLSSVSEGLSNTVLEAMAAGVPVVATRVGGTDEMVEDGVTGLLVPPGVPDELAEALAALVRDPERRRRFGSAARSRVRSEFSLEAMLHRYESLYVDLLQRKGSGRQPLGEASLAARS